MPTYEYKCETCDDRLEVFASMSDPGPDTCDACGAHGTMVKVLFPVAVHYKGSGFYSTDYASKSGASKPAASDSGSSSSSSSDGGSTSTSSDSSGSSSTPSSGSSSSSSSDS